MMRPRVLPAAAKADKTKGSPVSVQAYRACWDSFAFSYPRLDSTNSEDELRKQVSTYLDGLNDAETFIESIEDMARMMIREGM